MAARLKIDTKEFERDFRRYLKTTKRSIPDAVNSRMYFVVRRALAKTPKADKAAIEQELREVVRTHTKSGRQLVRPKTKPTRRVYRLVNHYRKLAGEPAIGGKEMTGPARQFIARRLRSVGALKSGWLAALRKFARVAGERFSAAGLPRVKQGSRATTAKPKDTFRALAEVVYRMTSDVNGTRRVHPFSRAALERAFAEERIEMNKHVERKLQRDADRVLGR